MYIFHADRVSKLKLNKNPFTHHIHIFYIILYEILWNWKILEIRLAVMCSFISPAHPSSLTHFLRVRSFVHFRSFHIFVLFIALLCAFSYLLRHFRNFHWKKSLEHILSPVFFFFLLFLFENQIKPSYIRFNICVPFSCVGKLKK